jgi:hypothetical protein
MFSDLAPISESGYRAQINADPAIRQGVQFLNDGQGFITDLIPSLNLISQTDGVGIGSAKIIKGKIVEGLTTTPSTTTTQSSPATTTPTTTTPTTIIPVTTTTTPQIVDIGPLMAEYQSTLKSFNNNISTLSENYGGGAAPNDDNIPIDAGMSLDVGLVRRRLLDGTKYMSNNLDSIYNKLTNITNNNIKITNTEYENIMNELNNIKAEIISNYQQLNKYERSIDYISPVAGAEETSILSTQRYYVYILWFIITVIVLYITISNLINPSSSTWSLAVSLIILIGLFAFLVYNNIGTWYTKVDDDIRSIHLPSFNNLFNFNPLVSIKYTS